MKIKNKKLNIAILTLFATGNFFLPQNHSQAVDFQAAQQQILDQTDPQIQELKDKIESRQKRIEDLQKQQKVYEESLKAKRQQINKLKNLVGILDDSMSKLTLEIEGASLEIEQTSLEIESLNLQISYKEKEISDQQARMAGIFKTLEKSERKKSGLEILVLSGTLGKFFAEINQLQTLQNNLKNQLDGLNALKKELNDKKASLEERQKELNALKDDLEGKSEKLAADKNVKTSLLKETRGQESTFQTLLAQVKAEQAQIESDIQNLEVQARKRLAETQGILPNDAGFIWPVPSRKVAAYFHDPDYPFRYIFEHPAIDIGSTPQGTAVRAAASGYVARVQFVPGSTKYGYILLVHNGGLSTVYGHISKAYVTEDSFVVQGEVIALSGGLPGTAGSGNLTTGPHLHFETRLNGIPVNPLDYLP